MVAQKLGNTPAICRKCYVHPGILDAYPGGLEGVPGVGRADFATLRHTRGQEMGVLKVLFGEGAGAKSGKVKRFFRKAPRKQAMLPPSQAGRASAGLPHYN